MSSTYDFIVPAEYDGCTARAFLRRGCSLSAHILTVLRQTENGITRKGELLRTVDKVSAGDEIRLTLMSERCGIEPIKGTLSVVYEDSSMLIVNKPSGMPVHPTKQHQLDTLSNIVAYHMRTRSESYVFRSLYRLDSDTTGGVLIAKDIIAYARLRDHTKTYLGICEGRYSEHITLSAPISLKVGSKMVRCVSDDGDTAVTHIEPELSSERYSVLHYVLDTGRTHQIRCHMAHLGHPLAGDDLYGGSRRDIGRHALHCDTLTLSHPHTGERMMFSFPLPQDMAELIESCIQPYSGT